MDTQGGMSRNTGPGLYEFLMEAELQQYYPGIRGDLKVQTTAQLKYVTEEDLNAIGMSKPEMRRLKKYFQKHFPQNYLSKFKKMLLPKREEPSTGVLTMLPEERQDKPPIRVPNKHMIPADAIIVNKELGIGEFGVVQQGVWTNDGERIQVAIKCLSRERMQNNPIEFLKEAVIMHSIDHEHIVRLYGVVLDTNSLMLVTELAPLRSLLECLKEPSLRTSFPVLSLCDFAVQIADGMQYLEAKRLIHRDLAARNILVFSKNKVKISDFGLSRALGVGKDYYQTNFNVNLKLPIAWCAPECISYLKFTSASDVWAYGVTLWEMFSYGFQPWAALTGHQILEAIDDPNFQRLEQPECCPKDYFALMQQCWQHEPSKRPKFSELINLLPDLKPEQVQAVQDSTESGQLVYRQGDVITVLDKGSSNTLWKGVLNNGKTGFFNPAHTIAYLGSNLPSNKPGEFTRGDGKNAFSSQRRKIRTDMISSPQGDLKHTGHVGLDGAYFGDIGFLGGKYPHLPRQVVTPYKPQEDVTDNSSQLNQERNAEANRELMRDNRNAQQEQNKHESLWTDANSELCQMANSSKQSVSLNVAGTNETLGADHEYHEISDEENQDSPLRFDKSSLNFDFGPSLLAEMDQMFRSLGSSPPPPLPVHPLSTEHESSNVRNELREIQAKQSNKKKQATVKPISAADQKTLYSAIAMAQELTARSMTDLEHPPESPRTPASPSRRRKFSFKLPHQHSPKPDRRHFSEEAASIPDIQWLCSSLQSLSSTVSSIESLGAPSTLKLPLWDKASAEFCFAKSRELLTKPTAWTSYMDIEFDAHILDNAATKQNLVKSTEFLENGNKKGFSCERITELSGKLNALQQNGKVPPLPIENSNFDFSREQKRVSTSYVDRYFEQPKYFEDDTSLTCPTEKVSYFGDEALDKYDKINNLEQPSKSVGYSNIQEQSSMAANKQQLPKFGNCDPLKDNVSNFEAQCEENSSFDLVKEKPTNFADFARGKPMKFDSPREKMADLGTRPKISSSFSDSAKMNIPEFPKKLEIPKARGGGKVPLITRNPSQEGKSIIYGSTDSIKTNLKPGGGSDSPRGNMEAVRINIQSFRKIEQNQNGHDGFPFVISNNPLFIAESEKKESPVYSSSESLRVNFQRLRRKSDAEANNQVELSSKLLAEKYQREVSGLESVKNYLDSKKGQGLNLGFGKLTQNMIQLGKNIAQNSRNMENAPPKSLVANIRNMDISGQSQTSLRTLNIPMQKPKHLDLNIPLKTQLNMKLNLSGQKPNPPSPSIHQHILEPPKLYQNDNTKKETGKTESLLEKMTTATSIYRHRTSSLSENRKPPIKNIRRSFHPANDSSEDSDSISHSETDIRSRFRYKRRHKKLPHNLRLNFKNKSHFLHPESARGFSAIELCGKSPPPSTSFLNSLSPPFSSRNNLLSWPESAPSSSLTFTSNSDLDSDTSSEYPEFTNDATLSDEAKEVYNSLVETPTIETAPETNPLRMLRSGVPIVRPRIRGNKHATLGHPVSHQEDLAADHFHFDAYHSGSRTLPKSKAPPPPHAPPPLPQMRQLERHHSAQEIENNQNQNNVDENPIPLPPRDRSKTLQPKSSLPRHQRKHPLIIPGGGVTRTLAKMAVTTPPIEDQVDGSLQSTSSSVVSSSLQEGYSSETSANSPEEFEQRIDSELAALDSLPVDENRLHRFSVISEDLLEFSDNLIDCDAIEYRPSLQESSDVQSTSSSTEKLQRKISVESKTSLSSAKCIQQNETSEISRNSTPTGSSKSEDSAKDPPSKPKRTTLVQRPANYIMQFDYGEYSENSSQSRCNPKQQQQQPEISKECSTTDSNDSFHSAGLTGAYNRLSSEKLPGQSDLSRQSDHVSCEDLLEFACDGPNARRTRGPRNGEQSDEVRIMMKVLHEQSTPESCIAALNVTDWDVLAAIKLERLQGLLKKENNFVGLEDCKLMLNQCGGDVVKAAALLRSTDDTAAV
ncbi:activated Cdc42 kinase-like [Ceratina calcarata]|uniref:non-specific protein-tyrosine kinase n=1 Tax=Ceratina calcarata TaxID=156304 RepID=A0AAJ7RVM2_9HYME|nr:activated Cdc42 kinase-like [Ceratina calcarata]